VAVSNQTYNWVIDRLSIGGCVGKGAWIQGLKAAHTPARGGLKEFTLEEGSGVMQAALGLRCPQ